MITFKRRLISLLILLCLTLPTTLPAQIFRDDFISTYEGQIKTIRFGYTSDQLRAVTSTERTECEALHPGEEMNYIVAYRLERVSETANFASADGEPEADVQFTDEDGNHPTELVFCSADNQSDDPIAARMRLDLLSDSLSEETETARLELVDRASGELLDTLPIMVRNLDPGEELTLIPVTPENNFVELVAGGEDVGVGSPAITSYLAGVIQPMGLDSLGRVYFLDSNHHYSGGMVIRRIESNGTLTDFLDITISSNLRYFAISNDFVYHKTRSDFYRVDVHTGEEEFVVTFQRPPEHGCCEAPGDFAVDSQGVIYHIADNRLYRIDPKTGETTHYAGNGNPSGDVPEGIQATEGFIGSSDIAIDPRDDSVLVSIKGNDTYAVSRIDPESGVIASRFKGQPHGDAWPLVIDVDSAGDIYMVLQRNLYSKTGYVYRYSDTTGLTHLVGNGAEESFKVDAEPPLEIGIKMASLVVDANSNIYLSSFSNEGVVPNRIHYLDIDKNLISTVAGAHGFLGCASPTSAHLEHFGGMGIDANGIIYGESSNAILAIDRDRGIIYTVAGVFSAAGDTPDGEPAFGNRLTPTRGEFNLAVSPEGDIFLAEEQRIRIISRETGLLSTLAEGNFWSIVYHPNGFLYALSEDDDADEYTDIVRISIESGQKTVLVRGGSELPVVGESAQGRNLGRLRAEYFSWYGKTSSLAVDSTGFLYLSFGNQLEPDFRSGIYKINPQTKNLTSVLSDNYYGDLDIRGQIILDESNNALYYTDLVQWLGAGGNLLGLVKVDLTTGDQQSISGGCVFGCDYETYEGDPRAVQLWASSLLLTAEGELIVGNSSGVFRRSVLRISSEPGQGSSLIPGDITAGANVGQSVARHDNLLAIGVPNSSRSGSNSGEVLIYQDNDCRPILQERLQAPEGYLADNFGQHLTFVKGALVIGAGEASSPTLRARSSTENLLPFGLGIFGKKNGRWSLDQDLTLLTPPAGGDISLESEGDNFALGSPGANDGQGEVTVFNMNEPGNPATVLPSDPDSRGFGKSVAMNGNRLAVGAENDQSGGTAEIYEQNESGYTFTGAVSSSEASDRFATDLALNDSALYVGAPHPEGGRVFDFTLADLGLFDILSDPADSSNPSFGQSLAIEDGVLVVGAPETPIDSAQSNAPAARPPAESTKPESHQASGSLIAFGVKDSSRRRTRASLLFTLLASNEEAYGESVDISNGRIVVGAPETDDGRGSFDSVGQIVSASQLSGLWYDPTQDGEGYNLLVAPNGMVVFYYGYDSKGERLWLISETVSGDFQFGQEIHVPLYKALAGEFEAPKSSTEALVRYGLLSMSFGSLRSATFTINGLDGNKISRSTFLADATANSAAYSGLWYDPSKDGEGYNVISGRVASVIYYYGSTDDGERLWLISDGMSNTVENGDIITGRMYEAIGGDFFHPEPSANSLRDWGTIEARFDDCKGGLFILTGKDGSKTSDVIKLAGIDGAECD